MFLHLASIGILFLSLSSVANSYQFLEIKCAAIENVKTAYIEKFVKPGLLNSKTIDLLLKMYIEEVDIRKVFTGQETLRNIVGKPMSQTIHSCLWMNALQFGVIYDIQIFMDDGTLETMYLPATINILFDVSTQQASFEVIKVSYHADPTTGINDLKNWETIWNYPRKYFQQHVDEIFWILVANNCSWFKEFQDVKLPVIEFKCTDKEKLDMIDFVALLIITTLKPELHPNVLKFYSSIVYLMSSSITCSSET